METYGDIEQSKTIVFLPDHQKSVIQTTAFIALMRTSEIEEPHELLGFIPQIFDTSSSIKRDNFITKIMSKKCNWIFDSEKIMENYSYFSSTENRELIDDDFQDILSKIQKK